MKYKHKNKEKSEVQKAYDYYKAKTIGKDPNKITEVLCDPYSTKYLPEGGNCDPLSVTKFTDSRGRNKK